MDGIIDQQARSPLWQGSLLEVDPWYWSRKYSFSQSWGLGWYQLWWELNVML
jgi:hypothetical protein